MAARERVSGSRDKVGYCIMVQVLASPLLLLLLLLLLLTPQGATSAATSLGRGGEEEGQSRQGQGVGLRQCAATAATAATRICKATQPHLALSGARTAQGRAEQGAGLNKRVLCGSSR